MVSDNFSNDNIFCLRTSFPFLSSTRDGLPSLAADSQDGATRHDCTYSPPVATSGGIVPMTKIVRLVCLKCKLCTAPLLTSASIITLICVFGEFARTDAGWCAEEVEVRNGDALGHSTPPIVTTRDVSRPRTRHVASRATDPSHHHPRSFAHRRGLRSHPPCPSFNHSSRGRRRNRL